LAKICPLILQCRFEGENSHKYYEHIGFSDHGIIDTESELRGLAEYGPLILQNSRYRINYASFNYDKNLHVMIHDSGDVEHEKFPRFTLSNSYFPLFTKEQGIGATRKTFFPFHIRKDHLMTLVNDLETLYLPFTIDEEYMHNANRAILTELAKFLLPNEQFGLDQLVIIDRLSRQSLITQTDQGSGKTKSGWVEGDIIQFMIRW
jgi:hypothetical protein